MQAMADNLIYARFRLMLINEMARRRMSQMELARRSGVSFVTISRILNGHNTDVRMSVAERLLDAVGENPCSLLRKIPAGVLTTA
jgi:transcriptional regulator with XRE-family HTH domain